LLDGKRCKNAKHAINMPWSGFENRANMPPTCHFAIEVCLLGVEYNNKTHYLTFLSVFYHETCLMENAAKMQNMPSTCHGVAPEKSGQHAINMPFCDRGVFIGGSRSAFPKSKFAEWAPRKRHRAISRPPPPNKHISIAKWHVDGMLARTSCWQNVHKNHAPVAPRAPRAAPRAPRAPRGAPRARRADGDCGVPFA
jgi:hypothetical protein